jgi:hypothetical protein
MMFFLLSALLSMVGPGSIAATALMAPLGMAAAGRFGIPPFLMAIMIADGASAGSVSPFTYRPASSSAVSPRRSACRTRCGTIGANNFVAHATVAFSATFLLGGWRCSRGVRSTRRLPNRELALEQPVSEARTTLVRRPTSRTSRLIGSCTLPRCS